MNKKILSLIQLSYIKGKIRYVDLFIQRFYGDVSEKKIQKSATSNENVPGEGLYVPEHATLNMDRLVEDLSILKKRVSAEIAEPDFRARVIAKIQTAEDLMVNQTREKGALKV